MRSWDALTWQAQRIDELENECARLRAMLDTPHRELVRLRDALRCRPAGARLLLRLYRAPYVTTDQLLHALDTEAADDTIVKIQIYYLRRKLPKRTIETLSQTGYRLSDKGRAFVRSILETGSAQWIGNPTPTSETLSPTS